MTNYQQTISQVIDFSELTSDETIRQAAYPLQEWIENGGIDHSVAIGLFGELKNRYQQVAIQDTPPVIIKSSGILSDYLYPKEISQNFTKRKKNIEDYWKKLQNHECYKILHKNPHFVEALIKFEKKMQLSTTTIGYKSEFARFRFYHLVALYIQGGLVAKTFGQVSVFPNRKVITKSLGHIKSLLKDFDNGVKLQNYSEQKKLKIHLQQLHIELLSAPRKEKETETAQLRRFLESFAKASIYAFGEASTTILLEMAAMMGWNCDQSTMEGVVRKAKSNKRKKLIELLLDYPIKKDKF